MPRTETLTSTSEKREPVHVQQVGNAVVTHLDAYGLLPTVEARTRQGKSNPRAEIKPHQGIFAIILDAFSAALTTGTKHDRANYTKRSAHGVKQKLLERTDRRTQGPLIAQADDGYVMRVPETGFDVVIVRNPRVSDEEDTLPPRLRMSKQVDAKTKMDIYRPRGGEMIYVVPDAIAETLMAGDDESDVIDMMVAETTPYITIEVPNETATTMADNYHKRVGGNVIARTRKFGDAQALPAEEPAIDQTIDEPRLVDSAIIGETEVLEGITHEPLVADTSGETEAEPTIVAGEVVRSDTGPHVPDTVPLPMDQGGALPPADGPTDRVFPVDTFDRTDDKARLERQVARYTEKVATYEELAAPALAKRLKGSLWKMTKRGRERLAADEEALEDKQHMLDRFTLALDGALMKQWKLEGVAEDELVTKLHEHQEARAAARAARTKSEMASGPMGRLMERYANLSRKQKLVYGLGAGAVIAAAGAGAAVVGGVVAAGGAIGVVAAKAGKTYFQQQSKVFENRAVEAGVRTSTAQEQVFARYQQNVRERAAQKQEFERADKIKRIAGVVTIGSFALAGAGLYMKAVEHADDIHNFLHGSPVPHNSYAPNIGNADGEWVTPESSVASPVAEVPAPAAPSAPELFSADAMRVDAGEGWYQTFGEMGVTNPAEQANLLQKVGPELVARGWAYPMADGTYGISRPGALPRDVLELIQKSR